MGRRGPKPEPAAVKAAKGNPGRRPVGADPELPAGSSKAKVSPPTWLKKGGLAIWKRLAPRVEAMKLLAPIDAEAFARYCKNFDRWVEVNRHLDKLGATFYETETGYERVRAAMTISLRLEPVLERAEDRFGLNPSERQRIFAARASTGVAPDLFNNTTPAPAKTTPADEPQPPAPTHDGPVGILN